MKALSAARYIVWTQAGFRKACKAIKMISGDEQEVKGYPTIYPSLVTFYDRYEGYYYWDAKCKPIADAIDALRKDLKVLEEADAQHRAAIAKATGGQS